MSNNALERTVNHRGALSLRMGIVPGRSTWSLAVIGRSLMRYLNAVLVALTTISTGAVAEDVPASMSWEYRGADANVIVVLKPNGECTVIASLARGGGAHLVKCTYSVREPYVWLNWKHEVYGLQPFPSRLMLVADGEFMRIDGESQRMLRRTWEPR